jgi:hypothetical protein
MSTGRTMVVGNNDPRLANTLTESGGDFRFGS